MVMTGAGRCRGTGSDRFVALQFSPCVVLVVQYVVVPLAKNPSNTKGQGH